LYFKNTGISCLVYSIPSVERPLEYKIGLWFNLISFSS